MQEQIKVVFRNVLQSIAVENFIHEKVAALEKIHSRIIGCQVTIEKPQKTKEASGLYRVRLDITFPPKHEIVIKKESKISGRYQNLVLLINSAFKIAVRKLEELKEKKCVRAKIRSRRNRYDNLTFHSFPEK